MFYNYILRSIDHPEQRYNGKDLHRFCRQTENIHKCSIFSIWGVFRINL